MARDLAVKYNDLFILFLDYKLRGILQGENELSSAKFNNLIILLLFSNTKGLALVQ